MNIVPRQLRVIALSLSLLALLLAWPAAAPLRDYRLDIGGSVDAPFISGLGIADAVDEVSYRWSDGDAHLRLPAFESSAPVLVAVRTGSHWWPTSQPLTLTLRANGYSVATLPLHQGWDWYTATISPTQLHGGLNLSFESASFTDVNGVNKLGLPIDALTLHSLAATSTADLWLPLALALAVLLATLLGWRVGVWGGLGAGSSVAALLTLVLYLNRPLFALYIGWVLAALVAVWAAAQLSRYFAPQRSDAAVGAYLFAFALAIYLLLAAGQFTADDDAVKYLASDSLLTRQSLMLPTPIYGFSYSKYGIGPSIVNAPLLAPVLWLEAIQGISLPQLRQLSVSLLNPLAGALLVLLLYRTALLLYRRREVAAVVALIGGFATTIFAYALLTSSEMLLALGLLALVYCLLRSSPDAPLLMGDKRATGRWLARAGLLLAALVLLKEEYVLVAAVVIGWYGLRYWRMGGLPPALALRYAVLLILPTLLAVVANVAYNLLANGDALNPGYTASAFVAPVLSAEMTGIYGMLASPGKSLFLYSPPLLLLPFALPRFAASRRWLVGLGAAIATLLLLFYARLSFWSGDLAWGPRYIMPLTPLLVLPLGALLPSFAHWQGWRRGGVVLLLVGGVAVQLLSATVSFQAAFFAGLPNGGDIANHYSETQFLPWQSPLVQMSAMLTHGQITAPAVSHLSGYGLPIAADYLVPVLLVIIAASTGTRLWLLLHPSRIASTDAVSPARIPALMAGTGPTN